MFSFKNVNPVFQMKSWPSWCEFGIAAVQLGFHLSSGRLVWLITSHLKTRIVPGSEREPPASVSWQLYLSVIYA